MNILKSFFATSMILTSTVSFADQPMPATGTAVGMLCESALVDTIAVEAIRADEVGNTPDRTLGNSLLISFKNDDNSQNLKKCHNDNKYVYLKSAGNEALFNAMMSLAFMAKANNYRVNYMININATEIYNNANQLAFIQIVENAAQ